MPDSTVLPPACATPTNGTNISLRKVLDTGSNSSPLLVTSPKGDTRRFVVMREGRIEILGDNDQFLGTPFLDLNNMLQSGGERGLLGLAFHPQYATNRQFFIYFTRAQSGDANNPSRDVVARCEASANDPDLALFSSCVEILAIPDFASNHNGGMVEFGPDGFLYIGTGDGGLANDPHDNGQTLTDGVPNALSIALLGKLLRIDVDNKDTGKEYAVPSSNPFTTSGAPEVFALGLRNPWRFSFDSNGDIYIGDVGQGTIEEIDYVPTGQLSGKNFGWSMFEGSNCFKPPCDTAGKTAAVDERTHNGDGYGSITGGVVYRGSCFPDIVGTYFYGDYKSGQLARATVSGGTFTATDIPGPFPKGIASIYADSRGEIYVTMVDDDPGNTNTIYHLEAGP
jgi:glucose/arabinose dehydrogenase